MNNNNLTITLKDLLSVDSDDNFILWLDDKRWIKLVKSGDNLYLLGQIKAGEK